MFIPIYDGLAYRTIRVAWATWSVLALSCLFYAAYALRLLPGRLADETWLSAAFGVIPAVLLGSAALPDGLPLVPEPATLVSGQFVHLGFLHLAGNMLFLAVFGDNVEDAMGHARFALFYLACGAAGALAYAAGHPESLRPLVGGSGAVSGLAAAYLLLYPRARVWGLFLNRIPLQVPALWAIGFWIAFQIVQAWFGSDDVGWLAHLGGFAAGGALVVVLRRRDQPLFGAGIGKGMGKPAVADDP
ncbi:membrane associated rhomboid family serine protease [Pseudochelatococcus lubricantis]|uniref:Membrane associated rhomboid family serine protease n=1 Tax=Pseudochelatococcus lubricantis TaxID=1538102 RepID=A0ABX0UVC6_9HYPH|nr:rhomboid family intramembrane serine protease [Pseudochelatococcus lubricantis]NIJ56913.1 membrane associated rhomboid family serine protease [Pseudochelatococcus lubricantis]